MLTHDRKLQQKLSKKETKISTHPLGFNEEQSSDKSKDKDCNQSTVESNFENHGRKKAQVNERDRYLLVTSVKKNKLN